MQGSDQPLTVNSHIASANPDQARQGFSGAVSNGNLPQQLSGIGLNYVPGSADVSHHPFSPAIYRLAYERALSSSNPKDHHLKLAAALQQSS